MLKAILSEFQEDMLKQERSVLGNLRVLLSQLSAAPEDQQALADSLHQLDELFLLVIVGEFNAGKSAFINALLGQPLLDEGVTPTTTMIHILRHGDTASRSVQDGAWVQTFPAEVLRNIAIVDTPGTNAIIREHEAITSQFVPRADLVLFITSADRPFTESERAFLEKIKSWGKKIVFIINKIDILETAQVEQVTAFVTDNARALLNVTPQVYPVSVKLALRAKQGDAMLWSVSRFEPLEHYIKQTLDETERIKLKLASPLGVGLRLIEHYTEALTAQQDALKADTALIDDVERQTDVYKGDMGRDFRYRLSEVDNLLYALENRGAAYFDETMRLTRIWELIQTERIKRAYVEHVVADTPQQIERSIGELIDWLVDQDLRQWQAVTAHLEQRKTEHAGRIVGLMGGQFEYDRSRLLDSVGHAAKEAIESYDREAEAEKLALIAQQAVAETSLVGLSGAGLGAVVVAAISSTMWDITGVVLGATITALGLLVIPARRNQAKEQLRQQINALRQKLTANLTTQFEKELARSLSRLAEAVAPYTRFIRAERSRLEESHGKLAAIKGQVEAIRAQVEGM